MSAVDDKRPVSAGNIRQLFITDQQVDVYMNGGSKKVSPVVVLADASTLNYTGNGTCDLQGNCSITSGQLNIYTSPTVRSPVTLGEKIFTFADDFKPTQGQTLSTTFKFSYDRNGAKFVNMIATWDGSAMAVSDLGGYEAKSGDTFRSVQFAFNTNPMRWKSSYSVDMPPDNSILTIRQIKKFIK